MQINLSDQAIRIIYEALSEYRNYLERIGHEEGGNRSDKLQEVIDLSITFATMNAEYSELVS